MTFNPAKCILLKFKPRSNQHDIATYSINNLPTFEKTSHRDLGIIFSVTLQWRPHYENITAKAYKILAYYKEFLKTLSFEAKKLLYISLVRSCLLYCLPLWRPYLIQDILLLEKVQRRATKVILND